jgi:hypothetical protein
VSEGGLELRRQRCRTVVKNPNRLARSGPGNPPLPIHGGKSGQIRDVRWNGGGTGTYSSVNSRAQRHRDRIPAGCAYSGACRRSVNNLQHTHLASRPSGRRELITRPRGRDHRFSSNSGQCHLLEQRAGGVAAAIRRASLPSPRCSAVSRERRGTP